MPRKEECGTDRWGKRKGGGLTGCLEGLGREEIGGCSRDEVALGSSTASTLKNCHKRCRNMSGWWSPLGLLLCSRAAPATRESRQFMALVTYCHLTDQGNAVQQQGREVTQGESRGSGERCSVLDTRSNKICAGHTERRQEKRKHW